MNNFTYCNPTELVFGRGAEREIGSHMRRACPDAKKVLVVYGSGSVVRSGVLASVTQSCRDAGFEVIEKGGVHPNPSVEFVRECIDLARSEGVDLILAAGGGSVIDTAKAAAMGVPYAGDVWDFFCGKAQPEKALPVCCVLTIPAAGSEQSVRVVISNGHVKAACGNGVVRPKVSAINPEIFFTLPQRQMSAGVIDMMSHILERYFTNTEGVDFTSTEAEGALRVIMRNGIKLMQKMDDYEAWAEIGLAGSFAHNGFFGLGHEEDWACHGIEHEISAWHDITHGVGLAIITPHWMRYSLNDKTLPRFVQYGVKVWGLDPKGDPMTIANKAIDMTADFFASIGIARRLSEVGVTDEHFEAMAEHVGKCWWSLAGALRPIDKDGVLEILKASL